MNADLIWKNFVELLTIRRAIEESRNLSWRVGIRFSRSTEIKRELFLLEHGKNYENNSWLTSTKTRLLIVRKKHVKGACLIGDHWTISLCYRHQLSRFYGHIFLSAHQTFIYRFLTSLVKGGEGGGDSPMDMKGTLKNPKRPVSGSPLRRRNLNGQLTKSYCDFHCEKELSWHRMLYAYS